MDNYAKVKIVGKGNFGCAVLVQSITNRKYYIMKVIDITRLDQKQKKDALNEVKFLKELGHPFIITYRESFVDKERFLCIVMDYCEEGDLYNQIIAQKKTEQGFSEQQILDWFVQICFGLKFIHDRRILHRDLKTQNIFLTNSKQIKIGDFGIAKVLQNTCEMAQTAIGTPYYLSPEICKNLPYNQKSDIWSLGCILFELCTLRHPFDAKNQQVLSLKILMGNYPSIPKGYSPQLSELIGEMLSKNPSKRPSVKKILEKPFLAQTVDKLLGSMIQQSSNRKGNGSSQNEVQIIQQMSESLSSNSIERPISKNDENQAPSLSILQQQQQIQSQQEQQKQNGSQQSINSSFLRQLYQNQLQNPQTQQVVNNCDNIIQQQKLQYLQNQQEYKEKQENYNQIPKYQGSSSSKQINEDFKTPVQDRKQINIYGSSGSSDQQQSASLAEIKSQFPSFQQNYNFGQYHQNQQNFQSPITDNSAVQNSSQIKNKSEIYSINSNKSQVTSSQKNVNVNASNQIIPSNLIRQPSSSRQDSPSLNQNYKIINKVINPLKKSYDGMSDSSLSNQSQNSGKNLPLSVNRQNNPIINQIYPNQQIRNISPAYNRINQSSNTPLSGNVNQIIKNSVDNLSNHILPSSSSISSNRKSNHQNSFSNIPPPVYSSSHNNNQRSSSQLSINSLPQIPKQNPMNPSTASLPIDNSQSQQRVNTQTSQSSHQKQRIYNHTQQSDSDEDFEEPEDQRVKCEFLGVDGRKIPGMSEKDSIFNRIEALKVYLEKSLGVDKFIQIYQEILSSDSDLSDTEQTRRINSILDSNQQKFIPLIYQMVFCEDSYYTNS